MKCFVYASNGQDKGLKRLRESAKKYKISLETVGMRNQVSGKAFRWTQKLEDFRQVVHTSGRGADFILLCDGYDVRFLSTEHEIMARYHEICPQQNKVLVCGERKNLHCPLPHTQLQSQHPQQSSPHPQQQTIYKYPSTCILLGPRKLIQEMLDTSLSYLHDIQHPRVPHPRTPQHQSSSYTYCKCSPDSQKVKMVCDQSLLRAWLLENPTKHVIDTQASVFWSTRGEHKDFMKKHAQVIVATQQQLPQQISPPPHIKHRRLRNLNTGTEPCILHVPMPHKKH